MPYELATLSPKLYAFPKALSALEAYTPSVPPGAGCDPGNIAQATSTNALPIPISPLP